MNDGGPAYPTLTQDLDGQNEYVYMQEEGLSKLEWFAGMAMQSPIIVGYFKNDYRPDEEELSALAFDIAAAMLAEADRRRDGK